MTTTPTAPPELPGLDNLETQARAADQDGQHIYTNPRDSDNWRANEIWHYLASPAAVLALIALARRAQPEGEAPQAVAAVMVPKFEGQFDSHQDWVNRAQRVLSVSSHKPSAICVDAKGRRCHIGSDMRRASEEGAFPVRYFWECELATPAATLSPLCGAQPAQSGKETAQLSIGFANNDQGVHVSVMQQHADGAVTLLHQAKVPAGDSFARFAIAAQQAAAPGARIEELEAALEVAMNRETVLEDRIHELEHMLDGSLINEGTSAPGTPEAPADLPRLYRFDCYVGKTKMAAGVGVHASTMEEAEQKARKLIDKGETIKFESNQPCHPTRKCSICANYERAAQLDGGQEGSESNG